MPDDFALSHMTISLVLYHPIQGSCDTAGQERNDLSSQSLEKIMKGHILRRNANLPGGMWISHRMFLTTNSFSLTGNDLVCFKKVKFCY